MNLVTLPAEVLSTSGIIQLQVTVGPTHGAKEKEAPRSLEAGSYGDSGIGRGLCASHEISPGPTSPLSVNSPLQSSSFLSSQLMLMRSHMTSHLARQGRLEKFYFLPVLIC